MIACEGTGCDAFRNPRGRRTRCEHCRLMLCKSCFATKVCGASQRHGCHVKAYGAAEAHARKGER